MNEQQLAAVKQALEALEKLWLLGDQAAVIANPAITAIKQALSAPTVQEPVAWRYTDARGHYRYRGYVPGFDAEYQLLKPEALFLCTPPAAQPALPPMHASGLVAIKTLLSRDPCAHAKVAIEMIDEMLAAEPQPVPVKTYHDGKPWPVAPKPWVGLSRDEVLDIEETTTHLLAFYQAIEAKLKEKNT